MAEWENVRLGELLHVKHGYAFSGEDFSGELTGRPIIVTIGNFNYEGGFRFESTRLKECRGRIPTDYVLEPDDVVVVMTCQTSGGEILGVPGRIPNDGRTYLHNQRLGKLVVTKPDELDLNFAYWLMLAPLTKQHLFATASGSKILHTAPARIEGLRFLRPPLKEQRAIADVLGALDDKIESNRRLSKTATELCDQMFLSASDVESQISEAGQVTMGSSPPGDTYNTDGVGMPFYQGVTDFGFLSPTRRVWTTSPIREAKVGETLVSVRAPVGRLNEASEQCCIGRGVAAISSNFPTTLFYAVRQADAVWAQFEGEGTVFGSINKGDLESARIPWISPDRISELETELMDLQQCIRVSVRELESLTSLRDVLLPELLSGRLRVKDAESMMENV